MPSVSLTGSGIDYSDYQTPAGGMTSELLDMYEEGYWAATIVGHTSGYFGLAGGADTSAYSKIGRNVLCHGYSSVTSENSYSGYMKHNLPFTSASGLPDDAEYAFCPVGIPNVGQTMPHSHYFFLQGGAYAYMWKIRDDGTNAYMDNTDVDASWQVGFNFHMISA